MGDRTPYGSKLADVNVALSAAHRHHTGQHNTHRPSMTTHNGEHNCVPSKELDARRLPRCSACNAHLIRLGDIQ